jgi:hypothetical protein
MRAPCRAHKEEGGGPESPPPCDLAPDRVADQRRIKSRSTYQNIIATDANNDNAAPT